MNEGDRGRTLKSPQLIPWFQLSWGTRPQIFLIDSGATHSVVTSCKGPLSKVTIPIGGATGKRTLRPFLQPMECTTGGAKLIHEFLYMPECPLPLLGWDLLCKLNAQVTFSKNAVQLHIPPETAWRAQICLLTDETSEEIEENIPDAVLNAVIPLVWASKNPGKAKKWVRLK